MRRTLKILLYTAAVIAVVLAATYFVVTSEWFFRSQVLSRLGKAIGAPVTAEHVSWSPFSRLELTGLQVGNGAVPFLRAGTVRCRYSLFSLLGGTVKVSELLLDGVRVNVVQDANGKWNLPQRPPSEKTPAPPSATPSAKKATPPKLLLSNLEVRDLRVVLDKLAGPEPLHVEVNGIGIRLPELAPGKPVKLTGEGDLKMTQGTRIAVTSGHASGTLSADLGPNFMPVKMVQERRLSGLAGQIGGVDLAGHELVSRLEVERDGTAYRLREFRLEETAGGKPAATLLVTGTIELQPLDLALDIRIDPLSSTAINLAGALLGGVDFGDTTARYAGHVAVQRGKMLTAQGKLEVSKLTVRDAKRQIPPMPPMEFTLEHNVTVDIEKQSARLTVVKADLRDAQTDILRLELLEPIVFAWADDGANGVTVAPAKMNLTVHNLDLALVAPFVPASLPVAVRGGTVNGAVVAEIADLGQNVRVSGTLGAEQLLLTVCGKDLSALTFENRLNGSLRDRRVLSGSLQTSLKIGSAQALQATVGLTEFDLTTREGKVELDLPVVNDTLLGVVPIQWPAGAPVIAALNASAKLVAILKDKGQSVIARGNVNIANLTLAVPDAAHPTRLQGDLAFDVERKGAAEFAVRSFTVNLAQGSQKLAGGAVTGTVFLPSAKSESMLNISSDGIDGLALANLFPSAPKETKAAKPKDPSTPSTPVEPGPTDLRGLWLTANLDLKNVSYGEVQVPKLTGIVRIKDNRVEVKPLDLTLNGAPVHLEGAADLGKPGYEYSLAGNLAGLPIEPFMATLAPTLKDSVKGNIKTLELNAAGAGITPPSLQRNFRGSLNLVADHVVVQKLKALADTASQTGIAELERLVFDTVTIGARDEKGRIRLDPCTAAGKDLQLGVAGTVDFDSRLDLLVRIGVAGAIQARLEKKQFAAILGKKEGKYSMLGLGLPLRGYPAQLNAPNLIVAFLTQNLTQTAVNTVGNLLKDAADGKKIDTNSLIRGLLGGEDTAPATPPGTPAPPPTIDEAPAGTIPPATPPAELKPKKPKKPKTKDLLIDIGAGLLQDAIEGKK